MKWQLHTMTTTHLVLLNDVKKEGSIVTVDVWSTVAVGSGYERSSTVTGRIVSKGAVVKAHGCSAIWQWVEIDPQ